MVINKSIQSHGKYLCKHARYLLEYSATDIADRIIQPVKLPVPDSVIDYLNADQDKKNGDA